LPIWHKIRKITLNLHPALTSKETQFDFTLKKAPKRGLKKMGQKRYEKPEIYNGIKTYIYYPSARLICPACPTISGLSNFTSVL
jgi:hypothetical protein